MEVDSDDTILRVVAEGGAIDYSLWPDVLSRLIPRLEKIAHTDFPIPSLPQPQQAPPPLSSQPSSSPPQIQTQDGQSSQVTETTGPPTGNSSQSTDKENAPPTTHPSTTKIEILPGTLPPPLMAMLNSIIETMRAYFSHYPPHTIQRLSELILSPKKHYRTLPAYLHAVDRVVHVTSGANTYPLPAAVPDATGAKILSNGLSAGVDPSTISWGSTTQVQATLGSDESLGGALLTPIPWLRNQTNTRSNGNNVVKELDGEVKTESTETIDGPNGAGSVETVSVSLNGISSTILNDATGGLRAEGGVTQGELLRQEQRAGVVPASQLRDPVVDEDETPHARGPEEIGIEDTGPQGGSTGLSQLMQGIDVEAAVGRKVDDPEEESRTSKREADEEVSGESKRMKSEEPEKEDEEMADGDGDTLDEKSTSPKKETGAV